MKLNKRVFITILPILLLTSCGDNNSPSSISTSSSEPSSFSRDTQYDGFDFLPQDDGSYVVDYSKSVYKSEIVIPSTYYGAPITKAIVRLAIYEKSCPIKKITYGENITSLGGTYNYEYFNNLETVIFPNSLTTLDKDSFRVSRDDGTFDTTKPFSMIMPLTVTTIKCDALTFNRSGKYTDTAIASMYCLQTEKPSGWEEGWENGFTVYWYSETPIEDGKHWRYVDNKPVPYEKQGDTFEVNEQEYETAISKDSFINATSISTVTNQYEQTTSTTTFDNYKIHYDSSDHEFYMGKEGSSWYIYNKSGTNWNKTIITDMSSYERFLYLESILTGKYSSFEFDKSSSSYIGQQIPIFDKTGDITLKFTNKKLTSAHIEYAANDIQDVEYSNYGSTTVTLPEIQ